MAGEDARKEFPVQVDAALAYASENKYEYGPRYRKLDLEYTVVGDAVAKPLLDAWDAMPEAERPDVSTLFSISFLGHQLGAFIGAWAGGAVFDFMGSYQPVWLAAIAMSVIAAALCVPIDERAIVRPAPQGAG